MHACTCSFSKSCMLLCVFVHTSHVFKETGLYKLPVTETFCCAVTTNLSHSYCKLSRRLEITRF